MTTEKIKFELKNYQFENFTFDFDYNQKFLGLFHKKKN